LLNDFGNPGEEWRENEQEKERWCDKSHAPSVKSPKPHFLRKHLWTQRTSPRRKQVGNCKESPTSCHAKHWNEWGKGDCRGGGESKKDHARKCPKEKANNDNEGLKARSNGIEHLHRNLPNPWIH